MKTLREVQNDYHVACMTRSRQKQFYKDCIMLLEKQYDENYFIEELSKCKNLIKIFLARKKQYKEITDKNLTRLLYKDELKNQRRFLKTLKYLLNATRPFRANRTTIKAEQKVDFHKEKINHYSGTTE